ncbi:MAG TPA: hypothetical protein DD671_05575 [Balneolaceae bacterium]|nr:hypothetical protein [Balneolaceae bacterium]
MKNLLVLIIISFTLFKCTDLKAQNSVNISLFPGYHVINSDEVYPQREHSDINPKTNFIAGISAAYQTLVKDYPIQFNLSYSFGQSMVYKYRTAADIYIPNPVSADLRYSTLPIEAFWVHSRNEKTDFYLGPNLVFQHRTFLFTNAEIPNDRLLSVGIGISGKAQRILNTFKSNNGHIFAALGFRWTEFVFHHANGRNVDDFTMRHLTLTPQLGLSLNLD